VRWLEAISRYKGTTSGAPNFAYDLCVDKITPEQIETGLEFVDPGILRRRTDPP
jgi:hypothetical protein